MDYCNYLDCEFLSIVAFTRVGFILFWRATTPEDNPKEDAYKAYQALPEQAPVRNDKSVYLLLAGLIAYVVCAAPILNYVEKTALQISDTSIYQHSILKMDGHGETISVQPFDPNYVPETKYNGEMIDQNAHYIPYIISPETLKGEHISEFKQRQIQGQEQQQHFENTQLKPMEQ